MTEGRKQGRPLVLCEHGLKSSECGECIKTYNNWYAKHRRRTLCANGHPLRQQGLKPGENCRLCR